MAPSTSLKALLVASSLTGLSAFMHTTPVSFRPSTHLEAQRRGRPRGPVRTIEIKPPMNEEIPFEEFRVSVPDYTPSASGNIKKDVVLGIMSKADAIAKAKELGGLDVILINENSTPPVVKIVDYSKYRYEKEKKAKDAKKNSKSSEVKEVKMSYKIDIHDYTVRIKNASKFIEQGNRVKCTVQFKGREIQHDKLGYELLDKMAEDLTKICSMEGKPKREGRTLFCFLTPRPEVTKALNSRRKAEEKQKKNSKLQNKEQKFKKDEVPDVGQKLNAKVDLKDDDDDDVDSSLDELLGSDSATDELFN
mmetsp:Transcript_10115/g.15172  ORF Transcript_10115/g.15172 Transcript_10115/m.15172 type:complete len:306 (-) Transcript_10115:36-953(-)